MWTLHADSPCFNISWLDTVIGMLLRDALLVEIVFLGRLDCFNPSYKYILSFRWFFVARLLRLHLVSLRLATMGCFSREDVALDFHPFLVPCAVVLRIFLLEYSYSIFSFHY